MSFFNYFFINASRFPKSFRLIEQKMNEKIEL